MGSFFSQDNVDAAEPGELIGLMSEDGAPWCYSEDARTLRCSTLADRTTRSGIYELEEWMRLDRPYCANEMFRSIVLDNSSMTEAECRLNILERYRHCKIETCPQCVSPCNYPWAKSVADVLKCFRGDTHMGFVHYYMVSDAGQLAQSMHGAKRSENYIPVRMPPQSKFHPVYNIVQFLYAQSALAGPGEAGRAPLPHCPQQPHRPAATRLHLVSQRTSQLADAPSRGRL